MKKLILIFAFLLVSAFLNAAPKIDCQGNTTNCTTLEQISASSFVFKINDCWATASFSVMKCCTTTDNCEYIIDIQQIRTVGQCNVTDIDIKTEALKFAITKAYDLLNIQPFLLKTFTIKIPKCIGNETSTIDGLNINTYSDCLNDCCLAELHIINYGDKITILNQLPYLNTDVTCPTGTSSTNCNYSCNILNFLPNLPIEISYPYNSICDAECFWRLDGNDNVTESSFIGPTNGQDFVIKTKNSVSGTLMDRVIIDADNKIDFKLNAWNDLPQITFDADLNSTPALLDPTIKIYRHTGLVNGQGKFTATPWWISVNGLNGTNGWGAFNIWTSQSLNPAPEVGLENANMNKVFTILTNGNVGIGVLEPSQKLEVNGNISCTNLKVTDKLVVTNSICTKDIKIQDPVCSWPDYVFEPNYNRLSLEKLESVIKTTGKLPGIPSKDDVANNGINMVEMQAKLLEKIEELTLYLIELNKENTKLKSRLKNVENSNLIK